MACGDEGARSRDEAGRVEVAHDPGVDFAQYRTFALGRDAQLNRAMLSGLSPARQVNLALANAQMTGELQAAGLVQADPNDAALLAFSLARTTGEVRLQTWACVPGDWGGYWYWSFDSHPCAWLAPVDVEPSTLVAGLFDPARRAVVFIGFVHGLPGATATRQRLIELGIDRIFELYAALPGVARAAERDGGA